MAVATEVLKISVLYSDINVASDLKFVKADVDVLWP